MLSHERPYTPLIIATYAPTPSFAAYFTLAHPTSPQPGDIIASPTTCPALRIINDLTNMPDYLIPDPGLTDPLVRGPHPGFFAHPRGRLLPTMAAALSRLIPSSAASSLLPRFSPLDGLTASDWGPTPPADDYPGPTLPTATVAAHNLWTSLSEWPLTTHAVRQHALLPGQATPPPPPRPSRS